MQMLTRNAIQNKINQFENHFPYTVGVREEPKGRANGPAKMTPSWSRLKLRRSRVHEVGKFSSGIPDLGSKKKHLKGFGRNKI
jgi:hypothetical protein